MKLNLFTNVEDLNVSHTIGNTMLSAAGRVLVACEYSGIVRKSFAQLGWDAWSVDVLDTEMPTELCPDENGNG